MNKKTKSPILIKAVSLLLVLTFALYNVSFAAEDARAIAAKAEVADVGLSMDSAELSVDSIGIAIDCGTVKSRHQGKGEKIVIHIQDAHCNFEAQQNINRMLDQLVKECGVDLISVEGAEGIVDTSWFRAFPDAMIREEVATYFMKKGEITGAELFSITSDYKGTIFGAEDREDYIANLKAFTKTYPYKSVIENFFLDARTVANRLKGIIYPPGLKELDLKIRGFEDKEIELSDFAGFLNQSLKEHRISIKKYPNFEKLVNTLEYEKKIDFDTVDQERSEYIDLLGEKMSKEEMAELVAQSIRFKKGHIKAVDFYSYLREMAKVQDIPIQERFPSLFYYYIYTKLYDGIDNEGLFKELDEIKTELKERLFTDDTQRALDKYSRMIDMYVDLVNIELTNDNYDLFKQYTSESTLDDITGFLGKLCTRYGLSYSMDAVPAQISENLPNMIEFYELAMKRDRTLIDNTLHQMDSEDRKISVLITGGFHTRGIKDILEEKDVSYVVVMPKITKDVETPYIQVLTNQRMSLGDIFSESVMPSAPGAMSVSRKEAEQSKGEMLSPLLRFGFTISLMISPETVKREELIEWAEAIGAVEGGDTVIENARNNFDQAVEMLTTLWLERVKETMREQLKERWTEEWNEFVDDDVRWDMLLSVYLGKYMETGVELYPAVKEAIRSKFNDFRIREIETRTPGTEAVREEEVSLTPEQADAMNRAIRATIEAGKSREVDAPLGLGTFVVLDDETYIENAKREGAPLDVECHPGTRRTRDLFERDEITYDQVDKRFYIKESIYDKLSDAEKKVFARHEEMHIRIALGLETVPAGMREEDFVNSQPDRDVRPIMAEKFDSVPHMERLLDEYGDTAREYIEEKKAEIEGLESRGRDENARRLKEELDRWVRDAYKRRANIERLADRAVLPEPVETTLPQRLITVLSMPPHRGHTGEIPPRGMGTFLAVPPAPPAPPAGVPPEERAGYREVMPAVIPFLRDLVGKELPEGLPEAEVLAETPETEKKALLDEAFDKLKALVDKGLVTPVEELYRAEETRPYVERAIEDFLIDRDVVLADLSRLPADADIVENDYWFTYEEPLAIGNEKFRMLPDLVLYNQVLTEKGTTRGAPALTVEDKIAAENERRMKGIPPEAVARFRVLGYPHVIELTAEEVRKGWESKELGIIIRGSAITGNTVLLPGSNIVNSVLNNVQGKVVAQHAYIESSTAPEIDAHKSIVLGAIDKKPLRFRKRIVIDAFRPEIRDARFSKGQTRLSLPLDFNFETHGKLYYGSDRYAAASIRELPYNWLENKTIETRIRREAFESMVTRQEYLPAVMPLELTAEGVQGPVVEMTDMEAYINTRGVVEYLKEKGEIEEGSVIYIGGDLRRSTPGIMTAVAKAIIDSGARAGFSGFIPSSVLAYMAHVAGKETVGIAPSVMVTGAEAPAVVSGLVFRGKTGEILGGEEIRSIAEHIAKVRGEEYAKSWEVSRFNQSGMFKAEPPEYSLAGLQEIAERSYIQRYLEAFPPELLKGKRIVLYEHSAVGRDIIREILEGLGAEVITIGRSEEFVSVKGIPQEVLEEAKKYEPFAIISTNVDSSRPFLANENGEVIPGEMVGALAAIFLGPSFAAVPAGMNEAIVTVLESRGIKVVRAPSDLARQMKAIRDQIEIEPKASAINIEQGGGILIGNEGPGLGGRPLIEIPHWDAVMSLVAAMGLAAQEGKPMSQLTEETFPPRYRHEGVFTGFKALFNKEGEEALSLMQERMKEFSYTYPVADIIAFDFETKMVTLLKGDTFETEEKEYSMIEPINSPMWKEWFTVKEKLEEIFKAEGLPEIKAINILEGVKITFVNGEIVHLMPSENVPEFRYSAIAETPERAVKLVEIGVMRVIPKILGVEREIGETRTPGLAAVKKQPEAGTPEAEMVNTIIEGRPINITTTGPEEKAPRLMEYAPEETLGKGADTFGHVLPTVTRISEAIPVEFSTAPGFWIVTGIDKRALEGEKPKVVIGFSREAIEEYGDKARAKYEEAVKKYDNLLDIIREALVKAGHEALLEETGDVLETQAKAPAITEITGTVLEAYESRDEVESFYNYVEIAEGEVLPIPAGTLHGKMEGITVLGPRLGIPVEPAMVNITVWDKREPGMLEETELYKVERLPALYEAKGLEVHRITMKEGAEFEVAEVRSLHELAVVGGSAFVEIKGIRYEIPGESSGEIMVIPATVKSFKIIASEEGAEIINMFTPVPETHYAGTYERGEILPGVGVPKYTQAMAIEDFGVVSEEIEKIQINNLEVSPPEIIGERPHEITVQQGVLGIILPGTGKPLTRPDGSAVLFEKGDVLTVTKEGIKSKVTGKEFSFMQVELTVEYKLTRQSEEPVIVKITYEKREEEEPVYAVYEAVMKHMPAIVGKPIDLILPKQMFVPGEDVGSRKWEEEQLNNYVEAWYKMMGQEEVHKKLLKEYDVDSLIRIAVYDATTEIDAEKGLANAADLTIRPAAVAVLGATTTNIKGADRKNVKVRDFLAREDLRVMAIPDLDEIEGQGWFFVREVEGTGLLQAGLNATAVERRESIALDMQKLMTQLTRRAVSLDDLYFMLPFNQIPAEVRRPLEIGDPFAWIRYLLDTLLLQMPIRPFDPYHQMESRRKIMWAV